MESEKKKKPVFNFWYCVDCEFYSEWEPCWVLYRFKGGCFSLNVLIFWSSYSSLKGFLPSDEFQHGPHNQLCVCPCVLIFTCVCVCVWSSTWRPGQHIKTVTGRSHLVLNFTRLSSHLRAPISPELVGNLNNAHCS